MILKKGAESTPIAPRNQRIGRNGVSMKQNDIEKSLKKSRQWMSNWTEQPQMKRRFHDDPLKQLGQYPNNDVEVSDLPRLVQRLGLWHLINAELKALDSDDGCWTYFLTAANCFESYVHIEQYTVLQGENSSLLPAEANLALSLKMAYFSVENWLPLAEQVRVGIDSTLLRLRKNATDSAGELFKSFWCTLSLAGKRSDLQFDAAAYSFPPDLAPYDTLLRNWNSTDLSLVASIISDCCDYHIEQSLNSQHDRVVEFDVEYLSHYTPELLAWMGLRSACGLENPGEQIHPLMQLAFNRLPPAGYSPMPTIEALLVQVKAALNP